MINLIKMTNRKIVLTLTAFFMLLVSLSAQTPNVTYHCDCDELIDDEFLEFRITVIGTAAGEEYTICDPVGLFTSISPLTSVADEMVIPPLAGDPTKYEVTGFAMGSIMPTATIKGSDGGFPVPLGMLTCMHPEATLSLDGATDPVCTNFEFKVDLDVIVGGILNADILTSSVVWSTTGSTATPNLNADRTRICVEYPTPGTYTVSVEGMTTSDCGFSASIPITVVDPNLETEFTGPLLLCTSNSTDVTYSITNPNFAAFDWSSPDAGVTFSSTTTAASDVSFPGVGTYTINIVDPTVGACPLSYTVDVEVVDVIELDIIEGTTYACLNESSNYTITNPGDYTGEQWTISPSVGAVISPATGIGDLVGVTFTAQGTYVLTMEAVDVATNCMVTSTMEIEVSDGVFESIACNNSVNISLNNNCFLELEADFILEGDDVNSDAYTVEIFDVTGDSIVTSNMITQEQLGNLFQVTVRQKCGGNSCWGNLVVEDKSITPLTCNDDDTFTTCYDFDDTDDVPPGFPVFGADVTITHDAVNNEWLLEGFDNCSDAILSVSDRNVTPDPCTDPQQIERTWTVRDILNGATSTCQSNVFVDLVDDSAINWPPNFDTGLDAENGDQTATDTDNTFGSLDPCNFVGGEAGFPNSDLLCGDSWIADSNGNPSPECTGYPSGLLCVNLQLIGYKDDIIPICGDSKKILRKWTIWDACGDDEVTHTQIITVMDTRAPLCTAPPETQAYTEVHECGATVCVDPPAVAGECGTWTYSVSYKLRDENGLIPALFSTEGVYFDTQLDRYCIQDLPFNSDTLWVNYIIRDECGNTTNECLNEIELLDNEQPIPACDLNNSITLNEDGCAFAGPGTFDDNSWDNCGIYQTVIQRMDARCECVVPTFEDLRYLGTQGNSYYYLSKDKVHADRAFYLSKALEGYAVSLNSAAEATWVHDRVSTYTNECYIIGYSVNNTGGTGLNFDWEDGTNSSYNNWGANEPQTFAINSSLPPFASIKGDLHAFVNPDGTWNSERRNFKHAYYVVEIPKNNVTCGWSEKIKFCCEDVGEETMVAMRVIDNFGNHNQCMVRVTVRDYISPTLTCPPDVTIDCTAAIPAPVSDSALNAFDRCGVEDITNSISDDEFECGDDLFIINRTYTASDKDGNTKSCTQRITRTNLTPFGYNDINWPADHDFTNDRCTLRDLDPEDLPAAKQEPTGLDHPCSSIIATYDDLLFTIVDGYCMKLVRTWYVVDWCQPENVWTYDQVIKLKNEIAPQISSASCSARTVDDGLLVGDCEIQVDDLTASLDDVTNNCAESVVWSYTVHLNSTTNTGSSDRSGNTNDASGTYPPGVHTITWTVRDDCNNEDTCTKRLTVKDNKKPTPYCHSEVIVPLGQDSCVTIWASDLDLGSTDNCPGTTVTLSFLENTSETNLTLCCEDLDTGSNRGFKEVQLWVTDADGNKDYCTITIQVQDNRDVCDNVGTGMRADIAGNLMTEELEMIDEVSMSIMSVDPNFPLNDMASMGEYAFDNLNAFEDYIVEPFKDNDYLNGISTFDIILIQRHILGQTLLDSPYKLIAADVDNSQTITAVDLIELRKLILGIYDELPLNDSWRFVDASHQFSNPLDPFPYPENIVLPYLSADVADANFMGVKIGDVNGTVTANAVSSEVDNRSSEAFDITIQQALTDKGNHRLQFVAGGDIALGGLQFSMDLLDKTQDIIAVIPMSLEIGNENLAWDRLPKGEIVLSWNTTDVHQVFEGEVLFEVLVSGDNLSATMQLFDTPLKSEVYVVSDNSLDIKSINLISEIAESQLEFAVLQNVPNPFKDETTIEFTIPSKSNVMLSITDQNGRLVYTNEQSFEAGRNKLVIESQAISAKGVLYYQLSTDVYTATKKMIVIH